MLMEVELMRGIEQYGTRSMQDFVTRSGDMMDVLAYLRAERSLQMCKIASFVIVDSGNVEKRTGLSSPQRSQDIGNTGTHKLTVWCPLITKFL